MAPKIKRVAVLGAGVMGSGIAAHLAGCGLETLLLDIVPFDFTEEEKKRGVTREDKTFRNRLVKGALEASRKSKPPAFYNPVDAETVQIGNFEDDRARIKDCDWIVEVVSERLDIKRTLFTWVDEHRRPGSLVTSNTSGLSIKSMTEGRSDDFVRNFFVTHFFNPVRFMRLLELVPGERTDPAALQAMAAFGADRLGKGIVFGKDTVNFVANRIGVFGILYILNSMQKAGLSVEEVDALFGPAMGRPKSAVFRTADMVGLDTLVHVAENCHQNLPQDESRETFATPDFLKKMIEKKWLGLKTKGGFYKKQGDQVLALELGGLEYKPSVKVRADCLGAVKGIEDVGKKMRTLLAADDRLARYAWDVTAKTLAYAGRRLGEIADDVVNIDNGMKWGFNWELGPFETWDALGLKESTERMAKDGIPVPPIVEKMLSQGVTSFYGGTVGKPTYYDFKSCAMHAVPTDPRYVRIPALKEEKKILQHNAGATLYDIGDRVLMLEFHTKMNAVDMDVVQAMHGALDLADSEGWAGMVIANEHKEAFSAGANLFAVLMAINTKNWAILEKLIVEFQRANLRLRTSDFPVVAAPAGLALGGGAEVVMGCTAVRAHAELYMGLVELGVGVIPAGGGCLDMVERFCGNLPDDPSFDPMPFIKGAFTNIAMAKVSVGAEEAKILGYLRPTDAITLSRDLLVHDAKQTVLGMQRAGYRRPRPMSFRLPGHNGAAAFRWFLDSMMRGSQITEHEFKIASKIANILCGGDTCTRVKVSQQHILDLEREAFMSLCGEPKTQERMQYMLTNGKPLRN
jgi:3-hydroxyacyl-CoA dehydrogenase